MNGVTLTIDEIHSIREEHSRMTKDMPYDEYRKMMDEEIAPALLFIKHAKEESKNISSIVGIAHEYANPDLTKLEESAFMREMVKKHETD